MMMVMRIFLFVLVFALHDRWQRHVQAQQRVATEEQVLARFKTDGGCEGAAERRRSTTFTTTHAAAIGAGTIEARHERHEDEQMGLGAGSDERQKGVQKRQASQEHERYQVC